MKKIVGYLMSVVCVVSSVTIVAQQDASTDTNFDFFESSAPTTRLSRMSTSRIDAALSHYRGRMRRVQATIYTTIVAAVGLTGVGVYQLKNRNKGDKKSIQQNQTLVALQNKILALNPESEADREKASLLNLQQQTLVNQMTRRNSNQAQADTSTFWGLINTQSIKFIFTVAGIGLAITAGHQVFKVLAGTLEEMLQLWWHGYEYWYTSLEEQVRTLMNELKESFYQARKVAQQTSTEQQLVIARQQRRAPLAYEVSSHYRLDIVTMYQRLIGSFERLVALMLIIAPYEHHDLMHQNVAMIIGQCDRLATSLELDLNENTHGMLTHYSNKTLDMYHECVERMTIFLTTYRVYLRK